MHSYFLFLFLCYFCILYFGFFCFLVILFFLFFFFFSSRRRHTRCLSDWSSDVCSSDLGRFIFPRLCAVPAGSWMWVSPDTSVQAGHYWPERTNRRVVDTDPPKQVRALLAHAVEAHLMADGIGRA